MKPVFPTQMHFKNNEFMEVLWNGLMPMFRDSRIYVSRAYWNSNVAEWVIELSTTYTEELK